MAKTKLTKELIKSIVAYLSNGFSRREMCKALGIGESTYYAWLANPDTDLKRELAEKESGADIRGEAYHLSVINKAAEQGCWQASAWFLERSKPQKYGRCQRLPEKDEAALDAVRELLRGIEVVSGKTDAAE